VLQFRPAVWARIGVEELPELDTTVRAF
jgi:hypothetical protein